MKKFIIDEALLNGVMEYLSQRPWREVAQAMGRLQELEPLEQAESDSGMSEQQ